MPADPTPLDPALLVAAAAVLGLVIGSFLNVVIHRLPRMLERRWADECAAYAATSAAAQPTAEAGPASANTRAGTGAGMGAGADGTPARYNLLVPRSHCPACQTPIRWYHNIPLLGWMVLRGRCAACGAAIGWRYPLVELLTGVAFAWVCGRYGASAATVAWWAFAATVLALAFIDWDTTLLPDDLTLPLVWGGLVAAALGWTGVALPDALWGAVAGYTSLWSVYWAFKLLTGKEGMGYGDFKLLAALGAWLGWQALIPVVLVASALGALVGLAMKAADTLREGRYVPFGPFLAFGGLLVWALGPQRLLGLLGL
ncbi:Type 4 prepilin-like protein leader peptide-processing enzyme [Tepidimonas thermarum]|uniref:Prepilin leader peptidase/N-methyltransferase n=1 Tax=Tepidimonas thermarum TaxID=335431 RepID=A0A554X364_9BURK|nr:A24 family peptidase [Tepidimonas thermarum]TSE30233.1 Type 4 prepilin-like protein leader peptide-processing enzyme [Tepidimonas thermarum]